MKIRKYALGVIMCLVLITLVEYHFFYLFSYNRIMNIFFQDGKYFFIGILAVVLMLYIRRFYRQATSLYSRWLYVYCLFVIVAVVLLTVLSLLQYPNQKIADTLRVGGRFLWPVLAMVFMLAFVRSGNVEDTFKMINVLCFAWYIYLIIQSFIYAKTGSLLFSFQSYFGNSNVNTRNNALRVGLGAFGNIMVLYNFTRFYCRREGEKLPSFNLVQFVLGLYCLITIQQTRAMILITSVCIAVAVLVYGTSVKQNILRAILIVAIGMFLYKSEAVYEFFATFSNENYKGSSIARAYAYKYYLSIFAKSPIFGYGFAAEASNSAITHGPLGIAYTSDVGFIGLLAETGIFSLIIYIWPVIRIIKIVFSIGFKRVAKTNTFLLVVVLYILLTSATLIITDMGRCLAFPFLIAVFEYYYCEHQLE